MSHDGPRNDTVPDPAPLHPSTPAAGRGPARRSVLLVSGGFVTAAAGGGLGTALGGTSPRTAARPATATHPAAAPTPPPRPAQPAGELLLP